MVSACPGVPEAWFTCEEPLQPQFEVETRRGGTPPPPYTETAENGHMSIMHQQQISEPFNQSHAHQRNDQSTFDPVNQRFTNQRNEQGIYK